MAAALMSCIPEQEDGHVWLLKDVTSQACFRSTSAAPPVVAGKTVTLFETAAAMRAVERMSSMLVGLAIYFQVSHRLIKIPRVRKPLSFL